MAWRNDGVYTFDPACMMNRFHRTCNHHLYKNGLFPHILRTCILDVITYMCD
jgi:hypothetical protein